jgi:predicted PurR-regulated permease PerM
MKPDEDRLFYLILPITVVAGVFALHQASTLFLWMLCSFLLFAVIDPWMQRFTKKGANPVWISIVLVLVAFGFLVGMGFLIYKASSGIVSQLVNYKSAIYQWYENASHTLSNLGQRFGQGGQVPSQPQPPGSIPPEPRVSPNEVGLGVLSGLNSVMNILSFLVLTPLLTFFMVAERDLFGTVASKFFPSGTHGVSVWKQITDAITAFFLGNFILILVSFPIFILLFGILGVKAFLSLGLLSAIFNLVPFLGFVLAAALPTLDLLVNGGHVAGAIILLVVCCFIHFTVANVVTPKILGAKLNLNATFSTIALIGFGELWGPIGLIIAIPLTALIKILLEHSENNSFQALASMMSEDSGASDRLRLKQKKSR